MSKFTFRIGETEDGGAVKLDLNTFIHTRAAFIANSGGGKTHAMCTVIERSADKVQWILIDPEGEYAPLRKMFPNMLLIGKDGELPVDLKSAKLLARKIMETRVSTIVDLYGLLEIRASWTASFITALINLPKDLWSPVIVGVDEGHRLAPEVPQGNKAERETLYQSRKAIITLADSGRKQHRGAVINSQRVSKMAADARAELRNRWVGLTVQDLDRDRAADDLGFSKVQARELRDLKAGQFYVYGPAFVGIQGIAKIQMDLPETKLSASDEKQHMEIPPASDALKLLVAQIGDLPKQADEESNTLQSLERRNRELEAQLRTRPVQIQPRVETKIERVEVPVLNSELPRLEQAIGGMNKIGIQIITIGEQVVTVGNEIKGAGNQVVAAAHDVSTAISKFQSAPKMMPRVQVPSFRRDPPRPAQRMNTDSSAILNVGEKKILTAAAQYSDGVTREQLTILTGYKRSSRDTYLQRLSSRGYLTADRERVYATVDGIAALGADFEPLPTGADLREYWLRRLTGGELAVLKVAIDAYPETISREAIDEQTNYKRSSRDTYIQRIQARRLITIERGGIRASDELF